MDDLSPPQGEAIASHSSILAWKIPRMKEPGSPQGSEESDTTERLHFHFSCLCTGEGNGNPLQCSCLENPRDGGAWWAAICGATQSRIRLQQLSSSSREKSPSLGQEPDPDGARVGGQVRCSASRVGSLCLDPGSTVYSYVTLGKLASIPIPRFLQP